MAFVQEAHNDAGGSSTATVGLTGTLGNYLLVSVSLLSGTGVTVAITDSRGNVFTQVLRHEDNGNGNFLEMWTAPVTAGGADTVTATFSSMSTAAVSVCEYSGVGSNAGSSSG